MLRWRWRADREPGLIYNWTHLLCNLLGKFLLLLMLSGLWGYLCFLLLCFPGAGHPPGVLVSHDHWRAAPQSHRNGKTFMASNISASARLSQVIFDVLNRCLTWMIVAQRSCPRALKCCNIMQLSFWNSPSSNAVSQLAAGVSLARESASCWHPVAPSAPPSPCFEYVWARSQD